MAGTGWIDSTDDRHGLRALCLHRGVLPLMLNEGLLTLARGNLTASGQLRWLSGRCVCCWRGWQPGAATPTEYYLRRVDHPPAWRCAGLGELAVDHYLRCAAVAGALSAITLIAGSLWLLEHMGHHHGGAVAVCRGGAGDIYLRGGDRPWTCPEPHQPADLWLLSALCAGLLLALAIRWLLTPPAALVRVSHVETSLPASGSDTSSARRGDS
ncbi:major facilitator family transporter [Klebsiella pneumoniae]|uniref:Major facilitator family transporter n=1 Tax=Klebsiella pneumoniae TaxID=573 RepID=A0A2X3F897_KLEPN|nr:major facilitator family transporter [Klebsiella pneumoniae]